MMQIRSLKHKTKDTPIATLASPPELYLPLYGYKGIMELLVQPGQLVHKYQPLAGSQGVFATRVHAPVSGIAEGLVHINGQPHLKLVNDFKDTELQLPVLNPDELSKNETLTLLKEYGIEGSGGARLPAHLKYDTDAPIDTLIINGAECEPYLSADYALLKNELPALLKAILLLRKLTGAKRVVLAIEKQHKGLKKLLAPQLSAEGIELKLLPNEYPQGGELQLIKSVTGKELPKGTLPAAYGIVVSNVGTLWAIHKALYSNRPYTERIITISGEKARHLGNYSVMIGTPVSFIMQELGMAPGTENQTLILGGPMMGKAVNDLRSPVNKGTGGLLILPHTRLNPDNCIQCGYCADACPQRLMPMEFVRPEAQADKERLLQLNLNDCIACGACAYVCPGDVPLMKNIFAGKETLRVS